MKEFIALYNQYYYVLGIFLALVQIALILAVVRLHSHLSKVKRNYEKLFSNSQGHSLEKLFEAHADQVEDSARRIEEMQKNVRRLEADQRCAVQHVGLVRYNPFSDTGSDQSFSIAFLDDLDNGVVITSLHNRAATRVYAKPIQKGQPLYPLADEEKAAIENARKEQQQAVKG